MFLQGCNKGSIFAPKCSDKEVIEKAVEKFKAEIKPILINEWVDETIKESDIRDYAYTNDLDAAELIADEREKLEKQFRAKADINLDPTKIVNIKTTIQNDERQKCGCEAEIDNPNLNKIKIYYTAEKTEDSKDIYVEVTYEIKP